jgi:hypothetical protein
MIERINKSKVFEAKLAKEGKKVVVLNDRKHIAETISLNGELAQVRMDFKIKDQSSQDSAAQAILNS